MDIDEIELKMMKSLEALDAKYLNIRAGRANPSMLNGIMVDFYGVPTPINSVANITVPEARQLFIKPFDRSTLKDIESREKEAEKNAKQTAESILASARAEAENIVKRARLDSEESIRAYEISADRKIDEIKISVQAEQEKLALMKKEVSDFKEKLFKLYKQHLDSLSKLPSVSKERQQEAEKSVPESTENQEDDQHAENTVEREVHPSADIPEPDKHKEKAAVHSGKVKNSEKTAEFVIDKKSGNKENKKLAEMFDNNLKFKDLKFGTDFDLNKDD